MAADVTLLTSARVAKIAEKRGYIGSELTRNLVILLLVFAYFFLLKMDYSICVQPKLSNAAG